MMTAYCLYNNVDFEKLLVITITIYEKILCVLGTNLNPKLVSC